MKPPEKLEYNAEIYEAFSGRSKDFLLGFYNTYVDETDYTRIANETSLTKKDLRKYIAGVTEKQAREYMNNYESLKENNIRTSPTIDFLADHYDIDATDLEVDNLYELLLLLVEEDLTDIIDEIIARSKLSINASKRSYVTPQTIPIDGIQPKINDFLKMWNSDKQKSNAILIENRYSSGNILILRVYKESSFSKEKTFEFRDIKVDGDIVDGYRKHMHERPQKQSRIERKNGKKPEVPSIIEIKYRQIRAIEIGIEPKKSETRIIFTDSFNGWRKTLDEIFEEMFGVKNIFGNITKSTSPVAVEIENELKNSIKQGDDPLKNARSKIKEKREIAKEKIENLSVPESQKKEMKETIGTIEISGSEIVDDQTIETDEFRLIGGLDELFESVDIEDGFKDMLKKSEWEKQAFVISVRGRAVIFSDGSWRGDGPGRLPDRDRRALQIFFESE